MTHGETQMQTQEAEGWSLAMFNNSKGVGQRMAVDRQKFKTRVQETIVQEVQRGRKGQGRQNGQAGRYRVRNRKGSKPGGLVKENSKGRNTGKTAGCL